MGSEDKHLGPAVLPIEGEITLSESMQMTKSATDWTSLRAEYEALRKIPKAIIVRYMQAEEKLKLSLEGLQFQSVQTGSICE